MLSVSFLKRIPLRAHLHLCRVICLMLTTIFVGGCYELHHGYFVAENVKGWKKWERSGSAFFRYPIKNVPNWYVQVGGTREWVHVRIGSDAYDPARIWKFLKFSDTPIQIIDEQGHRISVASDSFRSPPGQKINIGESQDITVIIPSFRIGETIAPELSIRLHWSDGAYRVWIPLQ